MTPEAALFDPDRPRDPAEIRPVFVNGEFNAPDDIGDWWLDIGHLGHVETQPWGR